MKQLGEVNYLYLKRNCDKICLISDKSYFKLIIINYLNIKLIFN